MCPVEVTHADGNINFLKYGGEFGVLPSGSADASSGAGEVASKPLSDNYLKWLARMESGLLDLKAKGAKELSPKAVYEEWAGDDDDHEETDSDRDDLIISEYTNEMMYMVKAFPGEARSAV